MTRQEHPPKDMAVGDEAMQAYKKEGPTESSLTLPTRRKNIGPSIIRLPGGGRCLNGRDYPEGLLRSDKEHSS